MTMKNSAFFLSWKYILLSAVVFPVLAGCQSSRGQSSTLAGMVEEANTPAMASGNFPEDARTYRTLFHRVAYSMGAEAGYYEGCIGADTTIIKQTLASYSLIHSVPKEELPMVENSYDEGRRDGSRGGCGKPGKAELLRSNEESAKRKMAFFSCSMLWYHSGSWKKEGDGISKFYKGDFSKYIQACDSNTRNG